MCNFWVVYMVVTPRGCAPPAKSRRSGPSDKSVPREDAAALSPVAPAPSGDLRGGVRAIGMLISSNRSATRYPLPRVPGRGLGCINLDYI